MTARKTLEQAIGCWTVKAEYNSLEVLASMVKQTAVRCKQITRRDQPPEVLMEELVLLRPPVGQYGGGRRCRHRPLPRDHPHRGGRPVTAVDWVVGLEQSNPFEWNMLEVFRDEADALFFAETWFSGRAGRKLSKRTWLIIADPLNLRLKVRRA